MVGFLYGGDPDGVRGVGEQKPLSDPPHWVCDGLGGLLALIRDTVGSAGWLERIQA